MNSFFVNSLCITVIGATLRVIGILSFGICGLTAGYLDTVIADNPKELWRMNDVTGVTTINGYLETGDITVQNATAITSVESPIIGDASAEAILINGESLYIPNVGIATSDGFSIEFWINPTDLTDGGMQIAGVSAGEFLFQVDNSSGSGGLKIGFDESNQLDSDDLPMGTLTVGDWYHVVYVFDSTGSPNTRVYRNGKYIAAANLSPTATQIGQLHLKGVLDVSNGLHFRAAIAELAIYNHAITEERVNAHFQDSGRSSEDLVSLPYETDFEAIESWDTGLENSTVWNSEGSVLVIDTDSGSGQQSILIKPSQLLSPGYQLSFGPITVPDPVFIDFLAKPSGIDLSDLGNLSLSSLPVNIAFVDDQGVGFFYIMDEPQPGSGTWYQIDPAYTLQNHIPANWIRLTYRINPQMNTWDLFVDEELQAINLPFQRDDSETIDFGINGDALTDVGFDFFFAGSENPLFDDLDLDGMEDPVELERGLDPAVDDRDLDPDGDGVGNIEEYMLGTLINVADKNVGSTVNLYVNNETGSDALNGFSAYQIDATTGPKITISDALDESPIDGVINIMETQSNYTLPSLTIPDRNLTLRPVGSITITLE